MSTADVERISSMSDPVQRNNLITRCYSELSNTFAARTGKTCNWCTFATWASKQAGQSIRKEDIRRKMEDVINNDQQVMEILSWIVWFAKKAGIEIPMNRLKEVSVFKFVRSSIEKSALAVGRGNNKVFEEIGWQFAKFIETCLNDFEYDQEHINSFCRQLRPGDPPDGQDYLRKAFTNYYASFFEPDEEKKDEVMLLANVQIGFHEQTRLQPEIATALNAAAIDPAVVHQGISELLTKAQGFWRGLLFTLRLLLESGIFKTKINRLSLLAEQRIREVLTEHLMTLTIPPGTCLRLGRDLAMQYPGNLVKIENAELQNFLGVVDLTKDSLAETGAVDWSDLKERMHYIADLFRCCHSNAQMFEAP